MCQLQNHVRDLQADCKDGQALASLQALLVAFEDKPIDEADPASADNFGEKWRRRLGSLLQCPKVVPVESQQETKGENAAVQAEGCPVWVQELMKELEVDCQAQRHRRAARQAQVEEDATMAQTLSTPTRKRLRDGSAASPSSAATGRVVEGDVHEPGVGKGDLEETSGCVQSSSSGDVSTVQLSVGGHAVLLPPNL